MAPKLGKFKRCGELNLHGMVDAEIKTLAE